MGDLVASAKSGKKRSIRYELITGLYSTHSWAVFAGIVSIYLFFTWYLNTEVLTDHVYFYSLGNKGDIDKLSAFLDAQHRMSLLGYLFIPIVLLLKISIVSLCLTTGLLFTTEKMPFHLVGRITLFAESAFVAGLLLKLLLLCFFHHIETLDQYLNFAPLSLYSCMPHGSIPYWLSYPLQTLDLFQLAYIGLLSAGLAYYCNRPVKKMFALVLASYGSGLICCMIGFAFLTFSN